MCVCVCPYVETDGTIGANHPWHPAIREDRLFRCWIFGDMVQHYDEEHPGSFEWQEILSPHISVREMVEDVCSFWWFIIMSMNVAITIYFNYDLSCA